MSLCLSVCLTACLSVCLFVSVSVSASVCLCLYLFFSVSLSVSVCLCLCLSLSLCLCLCLSLFLFLSLYTPPPPPHRPLSLFILRTQGWSNREAWSYPDVLKLYLLEKTHTLFSRPRVYLHNRLQMLLISVGWERILRAAIKC